MITPYYSYSLAPFFLPLLSILPLNTLHFISTGRLTPFLLLSSLRSLLYLVYTSLFSNMTLSPLFSSFLFYTSHISLFFPLSPLSSNLPHLVLFFSLILLLYLSYFSSLYSLSFLSSYLVLLPSVSSLSCSGKLDNVSFTSTLHESKNTLPICQSYNLQLVHPVLSFLNVFIKKHFKTPLTKFFP